MLAVSVHQVAAAPPEEIGPEFETFHNESGGVSISGDAISPRVLEDGHVVQYFERHRLELHSDNPGPYQVLLGRLGSQEARDRGLMDSEAFESFGADFESNPDCLYFERTGQQVCNGFKEYWAGHGADLGDEGVSARESIALFGYPISQEFTDPDTGQTIQYFERARFEYHGDGSGEQVMLGRIGASAWETQADDAQAAPEPASEPEPQAEFQSASAPEPEPAAEPEPEPAPARAEGTFAWPTEGTITQTFGHTAFSQTSGGYGASGHTGLDISNSMNTPIKAADGGTVTVAGWSGGYGNAVAIDHGNGTETWYGHLAQQPPVSVGQQVAKGEVIGAMGSTGFSTGPHLHFEVRVNGSPQNPLQYLP